MKWSERSAMGVLGILGGTFDPPHIAHMRLAIEAREALGLEGVLFIPAGQPPLRDRPCATPVQRLAMVRLAVAGEAGFAVDATEVETDAPSYTVDTLRRLREHFGPARPLVIVVGADAFSRLEAWHRWEELFALAHIGVATRPGSLLPDAAESTQLGRLAEEFVRRRGCAADLMRSPAGLIVPFAITPLDISATQVRQRLENSQSVAHLVPPAVLDFIESHTLYRTTHES